ncbi:MAG: hypothetical protein IPJ03_22355 [Ignavibacteriales bacterium]|nr:hypothetical protein [Ignavibacteriales bacterium]
MTLSTQKQGAICPSKMKKAKENISELKQFYEVEHLSLHTISCITGISTYRVAKLLKEAGVVTSRASPVIRGQSCCYRRISEWR